jgi:hypothetical protein
MARSTIAAARPPPRAGPIAAHVRGTGLPFRSVFRARGLPVGTTEKSGSRAARRLTIPLQEGRGPWACVGRSGSPSEAVPSKPAGSRSQVGSSDRVTRRPRARGCVPADVGQDRKRKLLAWCSVSVSARAWAPSPESGCQAVKRKVEVEHVYRLLTEDPQVTP